MSIGMFDPLRNEQKPLHVTFWLAQRKYKLNHQHTLAVKL